MTYTYRNVENDDLRDLLIFAFRYALGRQSTGPSIVKNLLLQHSAVLKPHDLEQVCDDIDQAARTGLAGDRCDVEVWTDLAALFRSRLAALRSTPDDPKRAARRAGREG